MMTIDVKRAYFYARARRPVDIEIPIEDYEEDDEQMVGKLNLSLYGTRDAAQNWAKEYTRFLRECGFKSGLASPCSFQHRRRELMLTVHGDDLTSRVCSAKSWSSWSTTDLDVAAWVRASAISLQHNIMTLILQNLSLSARKKCTNTRTADFMVSAVAAEPPSGRRTCRISTSSKRRLRQWRGT